MKKWMKFGVLSLAVVAALACVLKKNHKEVSVAEYEQEIAYEMFLG